MTTVDELSRVGSRFDLREQFPLSPFSIVRRVFPWLLVYLGFLFVVLMSQIHLEDPQFAQAYEFYRSVVWWVLFGGALVVSVKALYEYLYFHFYYYGLEEGHLVVSEGILLKEREMLPLSVITDIFIDRQVLDFLFGIYNLTAVNPGGAGQRFRDIRGLSKRHAVGLQDYISRLNSQLNPENVRTVEEDPPQHNPAPTGVVSSTAVTPSV